MPTYNFLNTDTKEEFEEFMSISSMETFLEENPHIQIVPSAPSIVSGVDGLRRVDSGFNDILKTIKKRHPRSNVNTF